MRRCPRWCGSVWLAEVSERGSQGLVRRHDSGVPDVGILAATATTQWQVRTRLTANLLWSHDPGPATSLRQPTASARAHQAARSGRSSKGLERPPSVTGFASRSGRRPLRSIIRSWSISVRSQCCRSNRPPPGRGNAWLRHSPLGRVGGDGRGPSCGPRFAATLTVKRPLGPPPRPLPARPSRGRRSRTRDASRQSRAAHRACHLHTPLVLSGGGRSATQRWTANRQSSVTTRAGHGACHPGGRSPPPELRTRGERPPSNLIDPTPRGRSGFAR
jgi:hypothetical protein